MPIHSIDAKTLKQWLDRGEAVVIDVREPAEHEAEHIQGAGLLPLSMFDATQLPCLDGKKLVVHCRSGGRSSSACAKILAENPSFEIYNLEGGISAWNAAGFDVNTTARRILPLDRQVQLTLGLILLASNALGFLVSPYWYVLTAFIGLGLTFAGLTGFCGLALLIARMPWNQCKTKH